MPNSAERLHPLIQLRLHNNTPHLFFTKPFNELLWLLKRVLKDIIGATNVLFFALFICDKKNYPLGITIKIEIYVQRRFSTELYFTTTI